MTCLGVRSGNICRLRLVRGAARSVGGGGRWSLGSVGLVCWALCLAPAAATAQPQSVKSLSRFHDAVVLPFGCLPVGVGKAAAGIRLYRLRAGQWESIPYQIDARDGDGEYVPAADAEAPDLVVDANDELVFMARDSGDRASRAVPAPAVEIELRDPLTEDRGWVYVFEFSGAAPPRSPRRYVSYDAANDEVRAQSYEIGYEPRRNFLRTMRIPPAAGGSGENILQRMWMLGRPTFSILATHWTIDITEDTTRSRVVSVTSGPVRVIRRTRLSVDLGRFLPSLPGGHIYTTHYPSHVVAPMRFSIPRIIIRALRSFEFESLTDFRTKAAATRYWDGDNPDGLGLGAGVSVATTADHEWWAIGGEAGTYLQALFIPDSWKEWGIARGAVLRGDESQGPSAGYSLLNMKNLREGGTYQLKTAMVILPRPYQAGDEVQPMAMFRAPLEVLPHRFGGRVVALRSPISAP